MDFDGVFIVYLMDFDGFFIVYLMAFDGFFIVYLVAFDGFFLARENSEGRFDDFFPSALGGWGGGV